MGSKRTRGIGGALLLAAVLAAGAAAAQAQDGAAPREIPQGFVLPGPPPANAPAAPGAAPTPGAAPAAAGSRPEALAAAPPPGTTDWPCVQRKVDEIAPAAVWNGPDLATAAGVARDADMARLVETVASRRLSLAEAEKTAADFAASLPAPERAAKATALAADLIARLNGERARIIRGIERYGARQKQFASALRERRAAFDALRASGAERTAVQVARDQLTLDQRVFDERRQSLSYVCEVPTLIEQRAFALARTLAEAAKG